MILLFTYFYFTTTLSVFFDMYWTVLLWSIALKLRHYALKYRLASGSTKPMPLKKFDTYHMIQDINFRMDHSPYYTVSGKHAREIDSKM